MASTQNKLKVSDMVFDIKKKITDEEYKNIMDGIKKINEKKYVKIRYMLFDIKMKHVVAADEEDDELYPELISSEHNTICQIIDSDDDEHDPCVYFNIHYKCVLRERHLDSWDRNKDDKERWPEKYKADLGHAHILICDYEEL